MEAISMCTSNEQHVVAVGGIGLGSLVD